MCSYLTLKELSAIATRQRGGWKVRSDVPVALVPELDLRRTTVILHGVNVSDDCGWRRREVGRTKRRDLALARLFRIMKVHWAVCNEIYYSA
jgi:hypothetical protein